MSLLRVSGETAEDARAITCGPKTSRVEPQSCASRLLVVAQRREVEAQGSGRTPARYAGRVVVRAVAWVIVGCLAFAGASASASAADSSPVVLRVVFPEGWSARQMADRVAEVRRIAIERRGVTPRLTGAAYARAARRARPPRGVSRGGGRQRRGVPLPCALPVRATDQCRDVGRESARRFRGTVADGRPATRAASRTYPLRGAEDRLDGGTGDGRPRGASTRRCRDLQPPRAQHASRDRRDAAVRPGIPGTRPLTKAHLASSSPYNTRRFRGLPPTPIGNPGLASIRAAANPARVDYLYYVRKPDKIHHFFTADDEEFCRKAREYGYSC